MSGYQNNAAAWTQVCAPEYAAWAPAAYDAGQWYSFQNCGVNNNLNNLHANSFIMAAGERRAFYFAGCTPSIQQGGTIAVTVAAQNSQLKIYVGDCTNGFFSGGNRACRA